MTQTTTHIGLREQILHSQSVDMALELYKKLTTGTYPAKYVSRCANALKRTEQRLIKAANANIPAKTTGQGGARPKNNVEAVGKVDTDWSPGEHRAGSNGGKGKPGRPVYPSGKEKERPDGKKVSRRFGNSIDNGSWTKELDQLIDKEQ